MITENLSTLKIHKLTQDQYDTALKNGQIDENALYLTPYDATDLSEYLTIAQAQGAYETKIDALSKFDNAKIYTDEQIAILKEYTDGITSGQLDLNHNHDGLYYTKNEIDEALVPINDHINNDSHLTQDERNKLSNIEDNANYYEHPASGVTAGTYRSVTVNDQGHVTTGTNPTTLEGYGITDAISSLTFDAHTSKHAPNDAQANVIETIKVNGNEVTPDNKSVDIIVPTDYATSDHTHDYAASDHNHDGSYAVIDHNHDSSYAVSGHTHDDTYYTELEIDAKIKNINDAIDGKADSSHTHVINDITLLQSELDSKAESDHTHNYAGSASAGGAATSANKVNSSLTIQLNGVASLIFDGSADKSLDITPSSIGAAASSHAHDDTYYTEVEIDTKIKNINDAIGGKANSTHSHAISDVTDLQSTLDGKATIDASNTFDGEQKMLNSTYAPTMNDIASGIGCSLKNSRACDNQLIVAEIYAPLTAKTDATINMQSTVGEIAFYSINGANNGQFTGKTLLGKINSSGWIGNVVGNATSATNATQDGSGNVITSTYATKAELTAAIGNAIAASY